MLVFCPGDIRPGTVASSMSYTEKHATRGALSIMSVSARSPRRSDHGDGGCSYCQRGLRLLGLFFLGLGAVGIVLPLLPTTIFWILAAYCFGKSSPELREWVLSHPRFGSTIRAFVDHGVISRTGKGFAVGGIFGSFLLSALLVGLPVLPLVILLVILLAVALYIVSRPERIPS